MLEVRNLKKIYRMGDNEVYAINDVSLKIEKGDFVAIMGPSGSGKSSLMNILGLLDSPSSGYYAIDGVSVSEMNEDELAVMRFKNIGFIFQQFNLLTKLSTIQNVKMPLFYSKLQVEDAWVKNLLERVGLGKRIDHRTNELSGGQQQRVAIARSLVNHPKIIFADEPTGNLDSQSEQDILKILHELNEMGITIIMVTHEEEVGAKARRLIRMRDGVIQSDERQIPLPEKIKTNPFVKIYKEHTLPQEIMAYFKTGIQTLWNSKIRSGLSMLGIMIGVASVVAVLAIGKGAQKSIESQIAALGSNLLVLESGALKIGGVTQDKVDQTSRLSLDDAQVLKEQFPYIKDASPSLSDRAQVTYQNKNWSTLILGTTPSYAPIHTSDPIAGRYFDDIEITKRARVAVVGITVVRELFGNKNPIGELIKINKINFQIIGVLPQKGANGFRDRDDIIMIPITTAMYRLFGKTYVDSIDIEITDAKWIPRAEKDIKSIMNTRHRIPHFLQDNAYEIKNMADVQQAMSQSSKTMSYLLSSIAAISLLVGGIGIMNIMLVSVTERTKEIGLKKAIGARRRDISMQFLIESITVSTMGGIFGIVFGILITFAISIFTSWATAITLGPVLLAFLFSVITGVAFGIYPAQKASELNPIESLRHD